MTVDQAHEVTKEFLREAMLEAIKDLPRDAIVSAAKEAYREWLDEQFVRVD